MSVICVIQARMGSTRFPGKVLADLHGHPVIWHVYTRCHQAVPNTVVAIPASAENDPLADYLQTIDAPVFQWDGPEDDVLGRSMACLKAHPAEWVVRVTSDCPLVEPAVIRGMVTRAQTTGEMYVSNVHPTRRVPSGFEVEVAHRGWLGWLDKHTVGANRQHVTQYQTALGSFPHLSVDTPADLDRIRALTV
jgi:spore coat polysaccharide biosynthesis protein SpsF (cytidylyltransferase family)